MSDKSSFIETSKWSLIGFVLYSQASEDRERALPKYNWPLGALYLIISFTAWTRLTIFILSPGWTQANLMPTPDEQNGLHWSTEVQ